MGNIGADGGGAAVEATTALGDKADSDASCCDRALMGSIGADGHGAAVEATALGDEAKSGAVCGVCSAVGAIQHLDGINATLPLLASAAGEATV